MDLKYMSPTLVDYQGVLLCFYSVYSLCNDRLHVSIDT